MAKRIMTQTFDYDDIMLVPKKCIVKSRSEIDTTIRIGDNNFNLPIIPANMSTVIDEKLAVTLAKNNYFYIMHRFNNNPLSIVKHMNDNNVISSISIGVQEADYENIIKLSESDYKVDYITIDIAHGDADSVTKIIKHIKEHLHNTFIIAGNVCTPDAVKRLENAGANALKIGIAPGAACLTGPNTGFGSRGWQLSAIEWCAEISQPETLIIADGGIKNYGDIAKSIAFGADLVMVGSMLAGHEESPSNTITVDGVEYKEYFGSASAEQKGDHKNVEGKSMLVPSKGSIFNTLQIIQENLQSSISYTGGKSLNDLINSNYVIL